jgi:DNA-binding transcriptional LysR family regulator
VSYQKVDLNLFALFETLMRCRSVSAASRELGVTASAVSHGLGRLRRLLGDELFVARAQGMEPTQRALELAPDIHDGLTRLAVALEDRVFDPAETTRTFAIAAADYASTIILPHVIATVATAAPYVTIKIFPAGRRDMAQQIDEGRLHIALGWFDTMPDRFRRQTLLTEHEAVVVRDGHPLTRGEVTKPRVLGFPHVVVDLTGSEHQGLDGFIDDRGVMRRIWIERLVIEAGAEQSNVVGRVGATVPRFSDVAPILCRTDMVATLPRRLALRAVASDGLVILDLPDQGPTVSFEMIWHQRAEQDPGLQWLLGLVRRAGQQAKTA